MLQGVGEFLPLDGEGAGNRGDHQILAPVVVHGDFLCSLAGAQAFDGAADQSREGDVFRDRDAGGLGGFDSSGRSAVKGDLVLAISSGDFDRVEFISRGDGGSAARNGGLTAELLLLLLLLLVLVVDGWARKGGGRGRLLHQV